MHAFMDGWFAETCWQWTCRHITAIETFVIQKLVVVFTQINATLWIKASFNNCHTGFQNYGYEYHLWVLSSAHIE